MDRQDTVKNLKRNSSQAVKHSPLDQIDLTQETKLNKPVKTIHKVVTPIKVEVLAPYLVNYHQASYLIKGFSYGFQLGYLGQRQFRMSSNMSSCKQFSDVISHKIKAEVAAGRLKGPFSSPPFKNIQISPIGCIPKKSPGDFRLIHHLSYPPGSSINDGIMPELASVSYCSFDDAVNALLKLGRGALMSKTDIESAFRLIPVHPSDHELLGYKWQSQFYYDCCLPFGCRSSPAIFERFSTAIEWIAKKHLSIPDIIHILDDFFMIGPPASERCLHYLTSFLTFCKKVGIPIKAEKTVYPTTCITFMGLELDSVKMEARLPPDKLSKARELLRKYCNKRKIRLRDLQSIIGYLSFCCNVVPPGRCFLRRLIDKTRKVSHPAHRVTLNSESRRDLQAWQIFSIKVFHEKL
ncbi:MAG: reverse transcriptase domain-containing protein, partial [Candidatus Thiodiazotropha sp.]